MKAKDGRAWGICGIEINGGDILEKLRRFWKNLRRFFRKSPTFFGETSEIISFLLDLFSNLLSKASRGKKWQMKDEMFSFVKNVC